MNNYTHYLINSRDKVAYYCNVMTALLNKFDDPQRHQFSAKLIVNITQWIGRKLKLRLSVRNRSNSSLFCTCCQLANYSNHLWDYVFFFSVGCSHPDIGLSVLIHLPFRFILHERPFVETCTARSQRECAKSRELRPTCQCSPLTLLTSVRFILGDPFLSTRSVFPLITVFNRRLRHVSNYCVHINP